MDFATIGNGGGGGGVTHEYVDLGLPSGTLWATCNIGASMPVEFGDRFAWGETQPKDVYNWDTYQYCIDGDIHQLTKYCPYSWYGYNGFSDTLTVLLPEDDVATVLWGGNWRMPTKAQWIELFRNTTHTFTTQNGVEGELFIASNGNSLFLPYISSGTYSRYWSSSLYTNSPYVAWQLYFNSHGWQLDYFMSSRYKGTPIRPVRSTHYIGDLPHVTTSEVTEYTSTTAICGGNVVFDGGVMVTERGVCWSTIHNPTLSDSNSSAGAGLGDFAVNITGLAPLTTYYVRAYATNDVGTVYGNEMSFTTLFGGGGIYEYVDLGLPSGTLWATCNVGSNSPEGYGVCFAWGETTPKTTYNWNTYQYCNNGDSHQLTKYCNNSVYGYNGFTDNLTTLLLEDDAATVNWGNGWRTPTKEEWDELWNNTTSIWATQNGMNGRLFTASNGNSIFVRSGDYWSSSIYYDYSNFAYLLGFWEHGSQWDGLPRCKGYPIRPVYSGSFPHVITSEVSVFTSSTATFGGNVVSDEGSEVTERGVCWSTTHNPTIGGNHASAGGGLGDFAVNVTGLASATTYYVRAYATNSAGTAYGNEVSFTTFSGGGGIHEYVDLGLPSGTLWATCNVGANTPEEYGDYFAWGETQPKDYYDWSTYQYCNGDYNQMTKYCNNSMYGYNGFTDDLTTLLPEDDAATVNWGNEWRMPTSEEFEELYQNTTSTWITQNGVKGMRFTSSNGNSLFLPAGGWRTEDSFNSAGDQGKFWSLDLDNGFVAWNFEIFWSGYSLFDDVRSNGLSIRPVRSTSPSAQLPEVIFGPIVTVGTDANIIGVVVSDGGAEVTDRGVCWSTSPNPNISGNHISAGAGVGDFSVTIQGLEFGTTYYVRAYATNSVGTAYSNEESFTPTPGGGPVTPEPPEGAIDGLFSVASDYQVFFSQGNLQYQASTNTWRFAENQWDYEGEDNNNISPTYDGWIDLFGWGTSGYNHGAVCYQPWSTSLGASDYLAYGNADYNLFDQTGQADWGYNAISNGGDTENQWRTLTESEWDYVLNMRNTTSGIRYALATVNGVKGLILISDLWQDSNYSLSNPNTMDTTFDNNVIDAVTWEYQFEGAGGCVFLPAAGERYGIGVAYVGTFGLYWSSNNKPEWGDYYASYFDFAQWGEPYPGVWSSNREYGFAVRLVQDAPNGSGSGNGGGGRK